MSAGSCDDCTKKICPLPRIGSKDWGWKLVSSGVYESSMTRYNVVVHDDDYSEIEGGYGSGAVIISVNGRCAEAKRIAELLARRDWRRENRGKK